MFRVNDDSMPAPSKTRSNTLTPVGYSQKNLLGVCGPLSKTLTLFMTKICDFPYPIYDLTLTTLGEKAFVAGFIQHAWRAFNGVEEGKARMGEGGRDEEVASSSKKKKRIEDQGAKIDTLIMTKMAAKWLKSIPNL